MKSVKSDPTQGLFEIDDVVIVMPDGTELPVDSGPGIFDCP